MGRLDDYRTAMLVADPAVSAETLEHALDSAAPDFDLFIVSHGLGPLWHERTGRTEFRDSRVSAEALYMAQAVALDQVNSAMAGKDVDYSVIKGAALREFLYAAPSLRTSHDIDLLVAPDDRIKAASALVELDFSAVPIARSISRELVLSRQDAELDLHWGLLREGRLRYEGIGDILGRRVHRGGVWTLNNEDTLFLLLVHPAFAKHLGGWDMGLHRVVDIVNFLCKESFEWIAVRDRLWQNGVSNAGWATLRWTQLLTQPQPIPMLEEMLADLQPGPIRRRWLEYWFNSDLSARLSRMHWLRILGLTPFLHDDVTDIIRAFKGRWVAKIRQSEDLAVFRDLAGPG